MANRGKCDECGTRVAVTKRGFIRAHLGAYKNARDFGAGMVCPGTGRLPVVGSVVRKETP